MRAHALFLLFLALAAAPAAGQAAAPGADGKASRLFTVQAEAFRSDLNLTLSDFDGTEWDGTAIAGKATGDANENSSYETSRSFVGLRGGLDLELDETFRVRAFARLGLVAEVYAALHEEGSFFVDWDDRPEGEAIDFRGAVLFGGGGEAELSLGDVRLAFALSLTYDRAAYRNRDWFTERTAGSVSVTAFRAHLRAGYDLGFLTPRVGLGALVYSGSMEADQIMKNNDRTNHYEASFAADLPLVIMAGADFDGGERLVGSVEVRLVGEWAFSVSLGVRL